MLNTIKGLLNDLQENVSTLNDDIWKVCIAADDSGELIMGETPVAIFDNLLELNTYTNKLLESPKTLTLALIHELILEVQA